MRGQRGQGAEHRRVGVTSTPNGSSWAIQGAVRHPALEPGDMSTGRLRVLEGVW